MKELKEYEACLKKTYRILRLPNEIANFANFATFIKTAEMKDKDYYKLIRVGEFKNMNPSEKKFDYQNISYFLYTQENKEIGEVDLLHSIDNTVTPCKEDIALKFIMVTPKYRNQKIGKTILNKVFEDIKKYEKQNNVKVNIVAQRIDDVEGINKKFYENWNATEHEIYKTKYDCFTKITFENFELLDLPKVCPIKHIVKEISNSPIFQHNDDECHRKL